MELVLEDKGVFVPQAAKMSIEELDAGTIRGNCQKDKNADQ